MSDTLDFPPPPNLNPTNLLSDLDKSTSNEQSGEEPSSTTANETKQDINLNRRLNIDDEEPSSSLFGCNSSVLSRQPNSQTRQELNQNHLYFHRQLSSPLRRSNGEKIMQQHEMNSIPLRRLPYQLHRKRNKNLHKL